MIAQLRQSTPMRLTLILIGVFAAAMFASFGATYVVARNAADEALHEQVSQELTGFRLETNQAELEERILAQIAMTSKEVLITIYLADDGRRIANVRQFPAVGDYTFVKGRDIERRSRDIAESYLVVSGRVGQGVLIIARSREQVSELAEVFWSIFLLSLLPTLGLAGLAGWVIASQTSRRVEDIRNTLGALTMGDLEARVQSDVAATDDLTQIGKAINKMATAQAKSLASLQQVSVDIAHDLKTPIQRVSVMLDRLQGTDTLTGQQTEIVEAAQAETVQIVKTFQSLLQIAQMGSGAAKQHFAPVDLGKLAASFVEIYQPDGEENGQILSLELADTAPFMVTGEKNLLGQVIANLLENAMRHTPSGTAITLGLNRESGHVVFTCTDTGKGIPEAEFENVRRRLYRLEHSRTTEGNGLGLSLVDAICALHEAPLTLATNAPGLKVSIRFSAA